MQMVPTPVILSSLLLHTGDFRVTFLWLTEKGYLDIIWKYAAIVYWWREIIPMGKTLNGMPDCKLCKREEMARCVSLYIFMSCRQWCGWVVRDLDWSITEKVVTGKSGLQIYIWVGLLEWVKLTKICFIWMFAILVEDDWHNKVMTLLLWIPVVIFLYHACSSPMSSWMKWSLWQRWGLSWVSAV